jgi:hypothetical protein
MEIFLSIGYATTGNYNLIDLFESKLFVNGEV